MNHSFLQLFSFSVNHRLKEQQGRFCHAPFPRARRLALKFTTSSECFIVFLRMISTPRAFSSSYRVSAASTQVESDFQVPDEVVPVAGILPEDAKDVFS